MMGAESEIHKWNGPLLTPALTHVSLHTLFNQAHTSMSTVTNNIWFEGPVSEAVALVNSKDCVFVVYIFGESFTSRLLAH